MSAVHAQPQGPAFDIVLLLHVACVVTGLAAMVASAATANRLRRLFGAGRPLPQSLVRYFRPGINWVGRSVYGIPVFGFALLAQSRGAYALADGWVMSGLVVFVVVALVGEGVLWPAERRLQVAVAATADGGVVDQGTAAPAPAARHDARLVVWSAVAAIVLLVVGTVLMVAQP
jgi:uncharacterized membrane protein